MKMKLTVILISSLFTLFAKAQTAEWLVSPQFSSLKYFAPKMYKITQNGKVGMLGGNGKVILPAIYDAINYFYEGRTVFVDRTSQGWQVKGVLTEDGVVNYVEGEYYLLPKYMFYSEGFLPVKNKNGFYGYLDDKCKPAFDFIPEEVHPFSEGFAVVGAEETFHWINTSGEQILPRLSNGGTPYGGTNFYNGMAYLWDEDGVFFVLDSDGKTDKISARELTVDFLDRVDTGLGEKVEYVTYEPIYDKIWMPKVQNELWTYISEDGKLLTPFQYDYVAKFSEGVAVAAKDDKYGLLNIVEDKSSFSTKASKSRHIYSPGGDCDCEFELLIPEKWKGQNLVVKIKDQETGAVYTVYKKTRNYYAFSYKPNARSSRESKSFSVEVLNNGNCLWQGVEKYNFVPRVKLTSNIRVNNADANASDRCYVTATIKNPSSIAVTTTVTLTGGGHKAYFDRKSVTITVPAYGVKSITSSFHVKHVELNGWCAVTTTDGTSARRSNIELKPF